MYLYGANSCLAVITRTCSFYYEFNLQRITTSTYNCSFTCDRRHFGRHLITVLFLGRGMLVLGLELENLFRAYTGLASARDDLL
jgi:hypothetical protein